MGLTATVPKWCTKGTGAQKGRHCLGWEQPRWAGGSWRCQPGAHLQEFCSSPVPGQGERGDLHDLHTDTTARPSSPAVCLVSPPLGHAASLRARSAPCNC